MGVAKACGGRESMAVYEGILFEDVEDACGERALIVVYKGVP